MRRFLVGTSALLLFAMFGLTWMPGALVAGTDQPNRIVDYETIYGSLDPNGSLKTVRLVDQLRIFGQGDVTVTDPMSTEDFRNLTGEGDADVQEDAVEWRIRGLTGSQELLTASTPDVSPPLEIVVTYYLDGEVIDGSDLVGKAGSVEMRFDVTNATAAQQEITYKDGSGTKQTALEEVPLPMVAELTLDLPKGTFTEVDAPGADVITRPDGTLVVRWSMVLIPPIGEVAQSFVLHTMTDGFTLGPIRLAGAPVAPKAREFLAYAEQELAGGAEAASSLYSGANEISGNLSRLHDGTLELLDGMRQLLDGSRQLASGLQEAHSGSGRLTSGLGEATSGSGRITGGLGELSGGLKLILGGLNQLADGLPDAQSGASQIAAGLASVDTALTQLQTGLQAAQGGVTTIGAGAQQIAAGAAASKACLTGGGATACGGASPSIQTLAGSLVGACTADGGAGGCPTVAATAAGIIAIATQLAAGSDQAVAGATAMANGAAQIAAGLGQAIAGIGAPTDAATASIRGGVAALRSGSLELAAGIGRAIAGLGDAGDRNTLIGGTTAAVEGADLLHAGSGQLTSGLTRATDGSGQLTAGLARAADGSGRLADGMERAEGGAGQIEQGVYLVNEIGVREVARSARQKAAEVDRQLAMMKAQDRRAARESLLYGPPSSDQADVVVGGSGVVLTLDALDNRESDSATRGIATAVTFAVLLGLGLVLGGMRAVRGRPSELE